MAVTQRQIADALGLSRSIVGEALSGHPRVSADTRGRVLEMARRMGYDVRANEAARSLIARRYGNRRRTGVLGLVIGSSGISDQSLGAMIFQGVHAEARLHDHDLLVMGQIRQNEGDSLPALAHDSRIDGLILVNFFGIGSALEAMAASELPVVTCLGSDNPPTIPYVMMDNREGMRLAVRHLAERGHRNIVHLSGEVRHSDGRERAEGFLCAMAELDLPTSVESVLPGGWGTPIPPRTIDRLIEIGATAVVCANDANAKLLWTELEARGVRIPSRISLIGVDDLPGYGERSLTTVNVPWTEIGRGAVRSLLALLAGEPHQGLSRVLPVTLVERESVATLPAP